MKDNYNVCESVGFLLKLYYTDYLCLSYIKAIVIYIDGNKVLYLRNKINGSNNSNIIWKFDLKKN